MMIMLMLWHHRGGMLCTTRSKWQACLQGYEIDPAAWTPRGNLKDTTALDNWEKALKANSPATKSAVKVGSHVHFLSCHACLAMCWCLHVPSCEQASDVSAKSTWLSPATRHQKADDSILHSNFAS